MRTTWAVGVKRSTGRTHTHTTAEHTTAEQTTHTNTERATAQRRLIVEVVLAAPKIVVVRFAAERRAVWVRRIISWRISFYTRLPLPIWYVEVASFINLFI